MSPPGPNPSLSPSHPLIAELAALRQQLAQYQRAAHQANIQLQGSRLELALARDENAGLRGTLEGLKSEVEVLRSNPSPPPIPPQSTALSELSLAHRRLSAKLDITEAALSSAQLELAATNHELQRLRKEREGDRGVINELRREREEWEEAVGWEKGERRKVEEQKNLVDLALQEYAALVHSLDPSAVPPQIPSVSPSNILQAPPSLTFPTSSTGPFNADLASPPPFTSSSTSTSISTSGESISNLLIGQRGVHRLFEDFTTTLSAREAESRQLTSRLEELERQRVVLEEQLADETRLRIECSAERDRVMRDDQSAAKVVERYMTFTQKTHATVHLHLENLRTRSGATQSTLRKEAVLLQIRLEGEVERGRRVREAVAELSEGLAREAAGRRREVALRLKLVAQEEVRERRVERWLDRVRRARAGAEGAVLEPDVLQELLDEGVAAISGAPSGTNGLETAPSRFRLFRKKEKSVQPGQAEGNGPDGEEASVARVLLAEELVNSLVADLQVETERRVELESQRVEWLARQAAEGVPVDGQQGEGEDGAGLVFDVEHEEMKTPNGDSAGSPESPLTAVPKEEEECGNDEIPAVLPLPPSPQPSPLVDQLRVLFAPLDSRSVPLDQTLHSLSYSLASLRASLPSSDSATTPLSPMVSSKKHQPFLSLSRRPPKPLADPFLVSLLDGLHEVIEDARVDLEISKADEERVYRGFEALLDVGKGGAVRAHEVLGDAREYLAERVEGEGWRRLVKRVEDAEWDLMVVQRTAHEVSGEGMLEEQADGEGDERDAGADVGVEFGKKRKRGVWESLELRTVTPAQTRSPSPLQGNGSSLPSPLDGARRAGAGTVAMIGNVGRSFSASVIGAPRRVSGLAGGLYRPKKSGAGEEGRELVKEDDDVE